MNTHTHTHTYTHTHTHKYVCVCVCVCVRARARVCQFFYSPTDAQVKCRKKNIKMYIKTAPTCFGALASTNNALPDDGVTAPTHFGDVLM